MCDSILIERLDAQLNPNAPVQLTKGGVTQSGICEELDTYRELALSSEKVLDQITKKR